MGGGAVKRGGHKHAHTGGLATASTAASTAATAAPSAATATAVGAGHGATNIARGDARIGGIGGREAEGEDACGVVSTNAHLWATCNIQGAGVRWATTFTDFLLVY